MSFSPRICEKDELHEIIYLAEWYFKSKYVRWAPYYCLTYGVFYLCMLFTHIITRSDKVYVLDLMIGALSTEVVMISALILATKQSIVEINQIRERYSWDNSFFDKREKCIFYRNVKIMIYAHRMVWVFTMLLFVTLLFVPFLPRFLYGGDWPSWTKLALKCSFYIYFLTGYYMGNMAEAYYAYIILHGYFQMNRVMLYLRHEFQLYEKISLNKKVYSYKYQSNIESILLRCIKQHQQLTDYGEKIKDMFKRLSIFQFFIAVASFSVGLYCYIFDPLTNKVMLTFGILHLLLCTFLYVTIGELFSAAYDNFYKELMTVDWYSMNRSNKKLYYMFLIFTQKERGIEVLPGLYATRPLLASLLKLVYSGFTLLASVQKNK